MVGSTIGQYRIIRLLGEGGMGAVYEAVNDSIERRVAVKVLHANYARQADIVARFFNEARAVNRIDHPGLVQIHEHGILPDGTAFIVMELLKGDTLSQRIKRMGGRLEPHTAVQMSRQVAEALAAAHNKCIIHRDLKPGNLMLISDSLVPGGERIKVLDFGIAKLAADAKHAKTSSQVVMGTPTYMSPEQCRGAGAVDGKADVYSLGVILYEMLAGRPPFVAEGAGELIGMHLYQPAPPIDGLVPHLSPETRALVHLLLSKDRDQRPTMADVVTLLSRLQLQSAGGATDPKARSHEPSRTLGSWLGVRRFGPVAALAVTLLGIAGVAWHFRPTASTVRRGTPAALSGIPEEASTTPPPTAQPPTEGQRPSQPKTETAPTSGRVAPAATGATKAVNTDTTLAASRFEREPSNAPLHDSVSSAASSQSRARNKTSTGGADSVKNTKDKSAEGAAAMGGKPVAPDTAPEQGGEDVLRIAEEYLREGRFAMALRAASAPDIAPTQRARAWRIIGTAACKTGDSRRASEAWSQLDDANRRIVQEDCMKSRTSWTSTTLVSAKTAYARGEWARALSDAETAVKNGYPEGWDIIGKVACRMEDFKRLNDAYNKASASGQRDIVSLCAARKLVLSQDGIFRRQRE